MRCNCIETIANNAVKDAIKKIAESCISQEYQNHGVYSAFYGAVYEKVMDLLKNDKEINKALRDKLVQRIGEVK